MYDMPTIKRIFDSVGPADLLEREGRQWNGRDSNGVWTRYRIHVVAALVLDAARNWLAERDISVVPAADGLFMVCRSANTHHQNFYGDDGFEGTKITFFQSYESAVLAAVQAAKKGDRS